MLAAAQSADCVDPCPVPPCDDDPCPVPPCDNDPCLTAPCPPVDGHFNGYFATAECSIDCPDGTAYLYSAPADAGVSDTSQQEADAFAASVCLQQAHLHQICFANEPGAFCFTGLPTLFTWTILVTGGTPPYTFYPVTGLPPSFTLDPTGILSGPILASGAIDVPIQVVDADGNTNTKTFTIYSVQITTTTLPDAQTGVPYNQTLGRDPAVGLWSIVAGSLPPGLTLNSATGLISGTATTDGVYPFTVALTVS